MMPHTHDDAGAAIFGEVDPGPTPEETQAHAMESAARTESSAEVEIARIEAETAIALAKLERSSLADEERVELEALRLEVGTLRGIAAPEPEPEPDVSPVAVAVDAGPPDDAPPPVVESEQPKETPRKAQRLGMW